MSNHNSHDGSLGTMSTLWTVVRNAGASDAATTARQELCQRYHGAVERFLRMAVRDDHVAAELAQDFALKVLRGQLAGANPEQGRFRDFVKGVLRHLINDHYRQRGKVREVHVGDDAPEPLVHDEAQLNAEWVRGWRQELLNRTWARLADFQAKTGQPVHDVLRFRSDNPELRSHEMAQPLGERLGKTITADWVRQMIHRARERFGELLLAEIAETLHEPTVEALEDELAEVELLQYCQAALEEWRAKPTK
jgi:DNA-directed RNA polymerase specialized sigma24 family protein